MRSEYIIFKCCTQQENVINFEGDLIQTSEFQGGNVSIMSLNFTFKLANNA